MENASFKLCPFCKEQIRKEAVKCRFCGEWLEQQASPPPAKPVTEDVQTAAQVIELPRPNSETLPVYEASEDLAAQMADKTNDQLVEMLKRSRK